MVFMFVVGFALMKYFNEPGIYCSDFIHGLYFARIVFTYLLIVIASEQKGKRSFGSIIQTVDQSYS